MNPDQRREMLAGTEMVQLRIMESCLLTMPRVLHQNDQFSVGQGYDIKDDRGQVWLCECVDKFQPHGPELTIFVFEKLTRGDVSKAVNP